MRRRTIGAGLFLAAALAGVARGGERSAEEQLRILEKRMEEMEWDLRELREAAGDTAVISTATEAERVWPLHSLYDRGFWFCDLKNRFSLRVGARVQPMLVLFDNHHPEDTSFFGDLPAAGNNAFLLRRARLLVEGNAFEFIYGQVEVEFGARTRLKDGFLSLYLYEDALIFSAGQFKEPFSHQIRGYYPSIERAIAVTEIAPGRDLGVLLSGNLGGWFDYGLGLFNGEGTDSSERRDRNDDKDFAGRLALGHRFLPDDAAGFRLGGSFTAGRSRSSLGLRAFEASGSTDFLTWSPGIVHEGRHLRYGAELHFDVHGIFLSSEYLLMDLFDVENGPLEADFRFQGFFIDVGARIGAKPDLADGVIPRRAIVDGGAGAFEFFFRFEMFWAEDELLELGYAVGTDRVRAFTVGASWIPLWNIRVSLNYARTIFDDEVAVGGVGGVPGSRPGARIRENEDVVLFSIEVKI